MSTCTTTSRSDRRCITPPSGQIADPTGLIRYKGKYHLFYMFDEWSRPCRNNKNWGQSISDDGINWEQLPHITNPVIDNPPSSVNLLSGLILSINHRVQN
ncbi:hypothetical protein BN8_01185 [Fibrisoma limi BUZ 3]|uniref:Glycosyl hydrolase family 32 N-terminal domain-containing protein n=1 Tax=Fibrisoma limi BUZ 3 TaxID=1185876 RepID=I2GE78_9BACT|nr:hypothetical protein [Fibrisoma limi]CCH52203.1 hypothetical protein BN8_01185 [Fibrisoma limi BUZ 3]